jgi:hypothetical protein
VDMIAYQECCKSGGKLPRLSVGYATFVTACD